MCEVDRKNKRVFESMYSMSNDRIRKRGTSLGEMTFYWVMNINTWNGRKTNELVQTHKF